MRGLRCLRLFACVLPVLLWAGASLAGDRPAGARLAIAELDYVDTSGEARDQRAEHASRLAAFRDALRADLRPVYDAVLVPCSPKACASGADDLIAAARRAGARLVLYGGVHKMSTLVQYAKIQVVDLEQNRLVFDRSLSFRGDDDQSWQRASRFLVRDLLSEPLGR